MEPTPAPERRPARLVKSRTFATTLALLAVTAVPVGASVLVQNFVQGDISVGAPCMTKEAGADSTEDGIAYFDTSETMTTADGVELLNEKFTISAMRGDRVITTDAGRITNNCDYPITIRLVAEAQGGNPMIEGDWTELAAAVYLGTGGGAATADFTNATNWNATPLKARTGTAPAGTVTTAQTGTVTLAAEATARIAWVVDAGSTATATVAEPATLRFTVVGTP